MPEFAVSIRGVAKRFPITGGYRDILTFWRAKYVTALDGVDLDVPKGGVFGLVGANGAGKTTVLKILAGLIIPDMGVITINGRDMTRFPERLKEIIVYVPGEERSLYWRLTARENLRFFSVLYEIPRRDIDRRISEVVAAVGLTEAQDRRVGTFSTGMKQRLSIARGLLPDVGTMLLDEPTRGMDPVSARQLWGFIHDELVERRGRTIVLATHNMEEATVLCGQVAIMYRGQVRACGPVRSISSAMRIEGRYEVRLATFDGSGVEALRRLDGVVDVQWSPPNGRAFHSLDLTIERPDVHVPLLVERLTRAGGKVLEVRRVEPTLSEAIEAVGRAS